MRPRLPGRADKGPEGMYKYAYRHAGRMSTCSSPAHVGLATVGAAASSPPCGNVAQLPVYF